MKAAAFLAIMLLAAGCGSDESPTGPSFTELIITSGTFAGQLSSGSSRFYSFTVVDGGTVTAMLASVTSPATGVALLTRLGVGLGVPSGTGCALTRSVETTSSLTWQLSQSTLPGVYCVSVFDTGALTAPVNFAIRFAHP